MKNESGTNRVLLARALSIALATAAGGALAGAGAHDPQESQTWGNQQKAKTQHAGEQGGHERHDQHTGQDGALSADRKMQAGSSDAAGQVGDRVVRKRVESALQRIGEGMTEDIRVAADNGVVELSGTLDSQAQVDQAVRAARDVEGVREVRGDLRLRVVDTRVIERTEREETNPAMLAREVYEEERSEQPLSDTWITTKVKTRLFADSNVAGRNIEVNTVNGVVTLSGYVRDREDLGRIVGAARATDGVRDVRSPQLRVGTAPATSSDDREQQGARPAPALQAASPDGQEIQAGTVDEDRPASGDRAAGARTVGDPSEPWSDAWITAKVKGSLLANPDISGINVGVETVEGVVRLSGTVSSQEQVDRAMAIARSIEGVREVDASDLQQITAAN